jgi:LmbE family N-acetylglucosaminyl deacetylase
MAQLRMLACFAHPDDEAFTASGVLAASTARGIQVRLVCATCGEEGDICQPGVATRETLRQVRHEELRRSCQVLGVQEPIMLGYRDSGWEGSSAQYHHDAFVQAPPLQVVGRLVEEIRRFKPHIVLTFEPDGVSGHKDHKAISQHTTAAVHIAGDPAAFSEQMQAGLLPYHPLRLFYVARLQGHRLHRATLLRQAGLEVLLPAPELRPQGVPLQQLHVRLDVTPYLAQKLASMRSHRTQMTPDWTFDKVPWDTTVAILGQEYLIQAHPYAPPGEPLATDFLEGLLAGESAILRGAQPSRQQAGYLVAD